MLDMFPNVWSRVFVNGTRRTSAPYGLPAWSIGRCPCRTLSCVKANSLLVLIEGDYGDSALVRSARDHADGNGNSITLLQVLPEVTRASRTDRGALVLPWQAMQVMKSAARFDLERLRDQLLSDRALPTRLLVRFGEVVDEIAAVCYAGHPHAVLVRSKPRAFLPWRNRDRRLMRRLAAPVLFLDADDRLVGEETSHESAAMPLSFAEKVKTLYRLPVFAGMSRKELEMIARNLDETKVDTGTTVVHEGRSNRAFWIVIEGELELSLRGKPLERIKPSGLVGVPSMLDGRPAWASVTAITPVRALVASTEQFRALRADDRIALRLWAATGARLRNHIVESMSEAG